MLVTVLVSMATAAWFADDPEHEEGFMRGMVIDEVGGGAVPNRGGLFQGQSLGGGTTEVSGLPFLPLVCRFLLLATLCAGLASFFCFNMGTTGPGAAMGDCGGCVGFEILGKQPECARLAKGGVGW